MITTNGLNKSQRAMCINFARNIGVRIFVSRSTMGWETGMSFGRALNLAELSQLNKLLGRDNTLKVSAEGIQIK